MRETETKTGIDIKRKIKERKKERKKKKERKGLERKKEKVFAKKERKKERKKFDIGETVKLREERRWKSSAEKNQYYDETIDVVQKRWGLL